MSRWLYLLLAVVFGAGAVGAAYLAWRGEAEVGLIAARPIHDGGEVEQGVKLSHEFLLVNRMGQTLTIKEVIKSCSCTEATCEPKELRPGEQTVLRAVWEVGGSRGKSGVSIFVVAELPDESLVGTELVMRATVKPDIEYAPAALEFSPGNEKQSIRFSPGTLKEFSLKGVSCTHRAFTARLVPGTTDTVEVTFQPNLWNADLGRGELRVETTSPHEPVCSIPLTVVGAGGDSSDSSAKGP